MLVLKTEDGDWTVMDVGLVEDERVELSSDDGDDAKWDAPEPPAGADRPSYSCAICGKAFVRPLNLSRHLKTHTGEGEEEEPMAGDLPKLEDGEVIGQHARDDLLVCARCGLLHTRRTQHTCGSVAGRRAGGKPAQTCQYCGREYARWTALRDHLRTHTGEQPFECSLCHRRFSAACNLKRHQRVHTGDRPYACRFCDKRCSQKHELQQHERVHTGERPHSCGVCDKAFIQRSALAQHMRIHSDERPFACRECGKRFRQRGSLRQHARLHVPAHLRPPTTPRLSVSATQQQRRMASGSTVMYVCETCGKMFLCAGALAQHTRIHTGERPYRCDVCEKSFTQATHLTQHTRTHTGERPFACTVCGKTFAVSGNRDQHVLTHTQERPYACGVCGKSFGQPIYLTRHCRIHKIKRKNVAAASAAAATAVTVTATVITLWSEVAISPWGRELGISLTSGCEDT